MMLIRTLLILCSIHTIYGLNRYRLKLDVGDPNDFCPKKATRVCIEGEENFLCKKETSKKKRPCRCFQSYEMDTEARRIFTQGTNGIRSKMATKLKIGNMNIIYYSHVLEKMANEFLKQCQTTRDKCRIIGTKALEVGQNTIVDPQYSERWPARTIRKWFLESGIDVELDDWLGNIANPAKSNFTQMIWPDTEFIGCGAARLTHGFMAVCYYHPAAVHTDTDKYVLAGEGCTRCRAERKVCSRTYKALCGMDYEAEASAFKIEINYTILAAVIIKVILKLCNNFLLNQLKIS